MKKESLVFIEHILECIKLIEEYTEGKSKGEFLKSTSLQDAIIRRIEIIGEDKPSLLRIGGNFNGIITSPQA